MCYQIVSAELQEIVYLTRAHLHKMLI